MPANSKKTTAKTTKEENSINKLMKSNEEKIASGNKSISLTIKDRLVMRALFPKESNLLTQILIRDIIEKTKIDQGEMENIEFKQSGNGFKWNEEKAREIKIEFTKAEARILSDSVSDLDKKGKITQELLDFCMKIKNME